MSTREMGMPHELRRWLEGALPREHGRYRPFVRVTPRDRREKRCAAYAADHYEIQAYYAGSDSASLGPLEDALKAVPGVYMTTQVRSQPSLTGTLRARNVFTNPEWPAALGVSRRGRNNLRAQVIALIAARCKTCDNQVDAALRVIASAPPLPEEWQPPPPGPRVVCLCGSSRFYDQFQQANYERTMAGEIVLSVGFYPHAKAEHGHGEGVGHDSAEKVALDELHKRKIDLADYVLVVSDEDGYFGESTYGEIKYARAHDKPVEFAVPAARDRYRALAEGVAL